MMGKQGVEVSYRGGFLLLGFEQTLAYAIYFRLDFLLLLEKVLDFQEDGDGDIWQLCQDLEALQRFEEVEGTGVDVLEFMEPDRAQEFQGDTDSLRVGVGTIVLHYRLYNVGIERFNQMWVDGGQFMDELDPESDLLFEDKWQELVGEEGGQMGVLRGLESKDALKQLHDFDDYFLAVGGHRGSQDADDILCVHEDWRLHVVPDALFVHLEAAQLYALFPTILQGSQVAVYNHFNRPFVSLNNIMLLNFSSCFTTITRHHIGHRFNEQFFALKTLNLCQRSLNHRQKPFLIQDLAIPFFILFSIKLMMPFKQPLKEERRGLHKLFIPKVRFYPPPRKLHHQPQILFLQLIGSQNIGQHNQEIVLIESYLPLPLHNTQQLLHNQHKNTTLYVEKALDFHVSQVPPLVHFDQQLHVLLPGFEDLFSLPSLLLSLVVALTDAVEVGEILGVAAREHLSGLLLK